MKGFVIGTVVTAIAFYVLVKFVPGFVTYTGQLPGLLVIAVIFGVINGLIGPIVKVLALPISFIHGTRNREFLPAATRRTYELLRRANGEQWYVRRRIPRYGHMDCFIGKTAARDVFPIILEELEAGPRRGLP